MNQKNLLKTIALVSVVATSIIPFNTFASTGKQFKDISKLPQDTQDSINNLQKKGIMSGYSDGTFKPQNNITRAEFAAMLVNALHLQAKGNAVDFADSTKGQWHNSVLNIAKQNGLLNGVGTKSGKAVMNPNGEITRLEMITMLAKVDNLIGNKLIVSSNDFDTYSYYKDFGNVPSWAKTSVVETLESGLISGEDDSTLGINEKGTRGSTAVIGNRILERIQTYNNIINNGGKILKANGIDVSKSRLIYIDNAYTSTSLSDLSGNEFFGLVDAKGNPKSGVVIDKSDTTKITFIQSASSYSSQGAVYDNGVKTFEGTMLYGQAVNGKEYNAQGQLVYEGSYLYGTRNGQGVLYYPNGIKRYVGDFQQGVNQGKGTYYNQDGTVQKTTEASSPILDYGTDAEKVTALENDLMEYWGTIGEYTLAANGNYKVTDLNNYLTSTLQFTPSSDNKSGISTYKNAYGYTYSVKFDEINQIIQISTKGVKNNVVKDYYEKIKLAPNPNNSQMCFSEPEGSQSCTF